MDYILGNSISTKHHMCLREDLFYAAGNVAVQYSYNLNQQTKFMLGRAAIHAVQVSLDGNYLFTGEQATKNPAVNIYKLNENPNARELSPCAQLKGHKFGIQAIAESPAQPYLVSLGSEPDKGLFLWDWKQGIKLTVNKLSKAVHALKFNPQGTFLVTAGQGHLKLWTFGNEGQAISEDGMLDPKSFIMSDKFVHKIFVDIVVTDRVYALTQDSVLCIFQITTRQLEKWMDIRASKSFSICHFNNYLICGCSDGFIRVFNTNLQHITTLSKPPILGNYNVEKGAGKLKSTSHQDQFADCVALQAQRQILVAVYSDRTMFVWDLGNFEKISVKRSFLNHSGAINDLQIMAEQSCVEATFFVTASSDQTLRIWHLYDEMPSGIRKNAYCKYLSRIIYASDNYSNFKHGQKNQFSIRCVRVSKDGNFLACGDSEGVLRIYSTQNFTLIKSVRVHESEILSMSFSDSIDYLATGSRDRVIHIYDGNFNTIESLEEHTSSVTHLKFSGYRLVSCSLDKSIIFREFNGQKFRIYHQEQLSRVYSMDISYNHVYVCLEKKIVVLDLLDGKVKQQIETESNSKILLYCKDEQNCQYIATYSEKMITILNNKFQIIQKFQHDHLTCMGFALDNKHFISAGVDGCLIFWKLNKTFKKKQLGLIGKKLKQVFQQQDLKSSKEWTINSFWIEEELRGFLNQQKAGENQPLKQIQNQQEEEIELIQFESDDENLMKPPRIEQALSPLHESEFDYKNQKFDFNDMKNLQQQLQQVHEKINKASEAPMQRKYQINKEEIIAEVNPRDEQSQCNFYEDTNSKIFQGKEQVANTSEKMLKNPQQNRVLDPYLCSDKYQYETQLANENLQTQQTQDLINQTVQDFQTERQEDQVELKRIEFDIKPQQHHSIVVPNPSVYPHQFKAPTPSGQALSFVAQNQSALHNLHEPALQVSQLQESKVSESQQFNNSLQMNNFTNQSQEQLKMMISQMQGISKDSIIMNHSQYNYEGGNVIQKLQQDQQRAQEQAKDQALQQLVLIGNMQDIPKVQSSPVSHQVNKA